MSKIDDMVEFIIGRGGGVSIVEIRDFLKAEGVETSGTFCLDIGPSGSNVVLWAGMSEPFVDLMCELLDSQRLDMKASNPMVYLIDGGLLKMPLALRPPKQGYKEPHWLPVVFWEKGKLPAGAY